MVTIEVTNAGGRTCEVIIQWGNTHSRGLTDNRGRVSFNVSPGSGTVYVDGREARPRGWLEGSVQVRR